MKILKIFITMLLLAALLAAAAYYWLDNYYHTPTQLTGTKIFIVEKGHGISQVATEMGEQGIIEYPKVFAALAKYYKKTNPKFGEYAFEPGITPEAILDRMQQGQTIIRKIVIPEGKSVLEIYDILQKAERLKLLAVPSELPAEGTLLPQTYYYHYGDTDLDILSQMQKNLPPIVDDLWAKRAPNLPFKTKEEAIILASIVEKETAAADERPMVASVFINRLNKGMKLESDPTAVYGITKGTALGHKPTAQDVDANNPYNTYIIPALPPGPICNPGPKAIEAVLHPAASEYLFFVASGTGGHNFAATYKEHVENIKKLREALKK